MQKQIRSKVSFDDKEIGNIADPNAKDDELAKLKARRMSHHCDGREVQYFVFLQNG